LFLILIVITLTSSGLFTYLLYETAFETQRERLRETVQSQASLIDAIARFNAVHHENEDHEVAEEATLDLIKDSHKRYIGFGRTGEFTLAKKEGKTIRYLLTHRHSENHKPPPVSIDSGLAEPMIKALSGQSGTMVGIDYKGTMVLAAYDQIDELGYGIVAKIDLKEIREPFIRTIIIGSMISIILILIGVFLIRYLNGLVITNLKEKNVKLREEINKRLDAQYEIAKLNRVIEETTDFIGMANPKGQTLYLNKAGRTVLGYGEREDLSLVNIEEFCTEESRDRILNEAIPCALLKGVWEGESVLTTKKEKKEITVSQKILSHKNSQGEIEFFSTIIRDITHERELEKQLIQSQKMEAIGILAGGIAHDFNNTLFIMLGFLSLVKKEIKDNAKAMSHLDEIFNAGERAENLIQQILTFARQEEVTFVPIDIVPLFKEAVKLLRSTLPSSIHLKLNIIDDPGRILGNPTQLHQVIINLCTNAEYAMRGKDGNLDITLSQEYIDKNSAEKNDLEVGEHLKLSIQDTGTGINPELLSKIFEPFFTTKPINQGTGLGLSIVHGIVRNHKGTILATSNKNQGMIFTLYFPVFEQNEKLEGKEKLAGKGSRSNNQSKGKVLIIDDEESIVKLLQINLESLGYEITATTSSLEALDFFASKPGDYDLVITDQTMPDLSGIDLAKTMLDINKNAKIILMTGFSHILSDDEIKKVGIIKKVMKPFKEEELLQIIEEIIPQR